MRIKCSAEPVVSVIMSVYNGSQFIAEAVESILTQSFEDFEFIIINDGSTDATQQIIESYDDKRIVMVKQENRGLTKSLNIALQMARSQFVARQDADDVSLPSRLDKQVEYLHSHPEVVLLGTGITQIDEHGRMLGNYIYPREHYALRRRLYRTGNPLPHSTLMFRSDAVRKIGGYNELFLKAQDVDLILRVMEHHRISSIPEPLVKLRYRTDSVSVEDDKAEQWKYAILALALSAIRQQYAVARLESLEWPVFIQRFEKWFETSTTQKKFGSVKLRQSAKLNFYNHNYLKGLRLLMDSVKYDPHWIFGYLTGRQASSEKNIAELIEISKECFKDDH